MAYTVAAAFNHSDAAGVSPTLFFLKIRKRDGYTAATAYDGERFLPLKPHAKD